MIGKASETILIGAGGIGVVVLEVLASTHSTVLYVVDKNPDIVELMGIPVFRDFQPFSNIDRIEALVCVGNNKQRERIANVLTFPAGKAIDGSAVISDSSSIGQGSMVFQRCIVQARAKIGDFTIINTAAQIDHDCLIGSFVHIAPACVLCGYVTVGDGANLGANTTVVPGVSIGKNVTTGAGAVVLNDLPDNCLAVGIPARVIRYF
jgi:sugar O-acyltransferase (sialic acid O-acetyltransferase NeuD family)